VRHTQEILSIYEVTTMVAAGEGPTPAGPENGGSSRFLTRRLYTIFFTGFGTAKVPLRLPE
jgi:hypothetical protein